MVHPIERLGLEWLAADSRCESSRAMVFWILFGIRPAQAPCPTSPGEFNQCLELLKALPGLRDGLPCMGSLSPEWQRLVESWGAIEAAFCGEAGFQWAKAQRAPTTGRMLRQIAEGPVEQAAALTM